ncbi:uncharacterized protein LOC107044445 [Diachasma alloeum]|uniref:uncharacterized protein LOC107044445 n=1 Tax=Diachasma alloeum TaxID=454923 RepID=UPI00073836A4|nr:uncharacterized protein LOC107044445 [Diachasma alloeum]
MAVERNGSGCSLYISRMLNAPSRIGLPRSELKRAIVKSQPAEPWSIHQTTYGLVVSFSTEADADKLIESINFSDIFQCPVQVVKFRACGSHYQQSIFLHDVPWAIPLEDLSSALDKQGITSATLDRCQSHIRIKIPEVADYEKLIREGLDFFGICRFNALPAAVTDRTPDFCRVIANPSMNLNEIQPVPAAVSATAKDYSQQSGKSILQCYRCQGFWHMAANCRQSPRCVRCGDAHYVDFCPRSRNNPICCHCLGPHHAGFRHCPVRLQLLNATPISLTLSADRLVIGEDSSSAHSNTRSKTNSVPQNQVKLQ